MQTTMNKDNKLKRKKLFNPDADDTKGCMLNCETTNLLYLANAKSQWAKKLYLVMRANFWGIEKVDMTGDLATYLQLSEDEEFAYNGILSYLIFLDSLQTNNLGNVSQYIAAPEVVLCLSEANSQEGLHCVTEDTEILTEEGFIPFNELGDDVKIAEYNTDGTINFDYPKEVIKGDFEGTVYNFEGLRYHQTVTGNHRMVKKRPSYVKYGEADELVIEYAKDTSLHNWDLPVSGKGVGLREFTCFDKLAIAYQADGSKTNSGFARTLNKYTYFFGFKKQRKIDRLISILKECGVKYSTTKRKDTTYIYVWVENELTKDFSQYNLSDIGYSFARSFIEELGYWDGTQKTKKSEIRYCNTNHNAINKVQAIAILGGYRVGTDIVLKDSGRAKGAKNKKDYYTLYFSDTEVVSGRSVKKSEQLYSGKIYCVRTSSGMFIIRKNGKVSVTGNSFSYQNILETSVPPEKVDAIYYFWRDDEVLKNRCEYIASLYQANIDNPTNETFLRMMMADLLLEGLYFWVGFYFFFSLSSRGLMMGTADTIKLIMRDELTHITLFRGILKDLVSSMDDEGKKWFEETFVELATEAVEQEIAWWKHIVGNRILGFNDESIEQFVKYVANKNIFNPFLLPSPFPDVKNPYKHLDLIASVEDSSTNKGNFFESSNNSYQQVSFSEEDDKW